MQSVSQPLLPKQLSFFFPLFSGNGRKAATQKARVPPSLNFGKETLTCTKTHAPLLLVSSDI